MKPGWLLVILLTLILPGTWALESINFTWKQGDQEQPVHWDWDGTFLRIDTPRQQFAIIVDTLHHDYTGLEIRDAKFWHFSWPKVEATLEHIRQRKAMLGSSFVADPAPISPPKPIPGWNQKETIRAIAGHSARLWETTDTLGRRLALWCSRDPEGPSIESWKAYLETQNRLALITGQNQGPDFPLTALTSLPAEAGRPLSLEVGSGKEADRLTFEQMHTVLPDSNSFVAPKTYALDPLVALDGLE